MNKKITNPMLVGIIELMRIENTPERRRVFMEEVAKATLITPAYVESRPGFDENGEIAIKDESRIQMPMLSSKNGEKFFMAFTDIEEMKKFDGDFCIGGACYPETHPESANVRDDIENLKKKVDAGCEFLTTQMFFDNNILYNFMYRALRAGVNVPIVAGIMPVTSAAQIKRICSISGNNLPQQFLRIVDRYGDSPEAMKQAGIAFATEQIVDLLANGINAVHIYSMNKPDVAKAIQDNVCQLIQ